jgi:hypothetical protein
MLGVLDNVLSPVVTCYATEDTVRIVNSFYLQSLQSLIPLLHVYIVYNLTRQYSILS